MKNGTTLTCSSGTSQYGIYHNTATATITVYGGKVSGGTLDIIGDQTVSSLSIYSTLLVHNTLDFAGAVERSGNTSFERARPNPVINGSFLVWQRGTSFAAIANGAYSADRWAYAVVGVAVHTISRSTDVPTVAQSGMLVPYSILVDCTTIDASIAAGDLTSIRNTIEGYNWVHLAQRQFTVSFWVNATKTGTYCFAIRNSGADRSYVAEYTVDTTATWEYKTITVLASPTAGTWDYTNGVGAYFTWALSCGSTFQTTAGAWQTGNFIGTSNQVNATDSTANDFRLALVKVEPGVIATPFILPDYQVELTLCQRYCWVPDVVTTVSVGQGAKVSTTVIAMMLKLPVTMRSAPALTHNITGYTSGSPGTTTIGLFDYLRNVFYAITGALTVTASNANKEYISFVLTAGTSWDGTAGNISTMQLGPSVVAIIAAEL